MDHNQFQPKKKNKYKKNMFHFRFEEMFMPAKQFD